MYHALKNDIYCSNMYSELKQDKSSDIEQQPPFGHRNKAIHSLKKGGVMKPTGTSYNFDKMHPTAVSENNSSSGKLII